MKKLPFVLIFALLTNFALGAEKNTAETGLAFLKIVTNPRLEAMGGVQTSISKNEESLSSNPAGLGENYGSSILVIHNNFLQNDKSNFVGIKTASEKNAYGLAVRLHNVDGIELRDDIPTDLPFGETTANFLVANFTYSRKHSEFWDYGISLKYLYEDIYRYSAKGFGIDLGTKIHLLEKNLNFGLSVLNLGIMEKLDTERTDLPKSINFGFDYRFLELMESANLVLAADYQNDFGNGTFYKTGLEIDYKETLFIRSGYRIGYEALGFSAGFGLNWLSYSLDYSFTPYKDDLGNAHNFGVRILF